MKAYELCKNGAQRVRARFFFWGGAGGGGGARWYGTCVDHHEHEAGSWKLELELELESANLLLLCSVCLSIYLSIYYYYYCARESATSTSWTWAGFAKTNFTRTGHSCTERLLIIHYSFFIINFSSLIMNY